MEKTFLTAEGKKELEKKLKEYVAVRRPEVINKIGEARSFGDLSENSEYDAAKDEQAQIEAEIKEMEFKIRTCEIIDQKKIDTKKVSIGCFVKVLDKDYKEEVEYKIVGSSESNAIKGLISNESPVGSILIGKKIGEEVQVQTPAGFCNLKILAIRS
ncbi:MAG: transcription elongation factor GreA [Clostridia bacterium]